MRLRSLLHVIGLLACASTASAVEVRFESEVQMKKNSGNFETLKAGDRLKLEKGDVALSVNPKGLPLLIVDPRSSDSEVTVSDTDMETLLHKQLATSSNIAINEIVEGLRKAELLLQKRDYAQARTVMVPLRNKYDYVASVLFLNASVAYLNNNKAQAREDLDKGLKIDPQNQAAQKLMQKLKENP